MPPPPPDVNTPAPRVPVKVYCFAVVVAGLKVPVAVASSVCQPTSNERCQPGWFTGLLGSSMPYRPPLAAADVVGRAAAFLPLGNTEPPEPATIAAEVPPTAVTFGVLA